MSNIGCLMSGLTWLMSLNHKYNKICADPERKANTSYFGVYSIFITIFVGGVFVLSMWGVMALMNAMDDAGLGQLLFWVFVVMLIIVMLYCAAQLFVGGLMGVVYQFRCNRRPISWIALAVFILGIAGTIAGVILVAGAVGID